MGKPKSGFHFRIMTLGFGFRDFFSPRMNILKEVGIKPGFHVLDYGCGAGGYIIPLAELVGESGKIYALDIHPLAVQKAQSIASKKRLANVQTICSDCKTDLPDDSMDAVLLYDILHQLNEPGGILEELHRILKPDGILSVTDHHLEESKILSEITGKGLFKLVEKGKKTYSFLKEK